MSKKYLISSTAETLEQVTLRIADINLGKMAQWVKVLRASLTT